MFVCDTTGAYARCVLQYTIGLEHGVLLRYIESVIIIHFNSIQYFVSYIYFIILYIAIRISVHIVSYTSVLCIAIHVSVHISIQQLTVYISSKSILYSKKYIV